MSGFDLGLSLRQPLTPPGAGGGASTLLNDLIAHYAFEEASGVRNDSHTNALHLSDMNTVGQAVGKIGNAANFLRADNEYLYHLDDPLFTFNNGFTVCGWVYPTATQSGNTVVSKFGAGGWLIDVNNDQLRFLVNGGVTSITSGATTVPLNQFSFFCARVNGTNIKLRLNAADFAPVAYAAQLGDNAFEFQVGARADAAIYSWTGREDLLSIYSRELLDAEVAQHYNGGTGLAYPFS